MPIAKLDTKKRNIELYISVFSQIYSYRLIKFLKFILIFKWCLPIRESVSKKKWGSKKEPKKFSLSWRVDHGSGSSKKKSDCHFSNRRKSRMKYILLTFRKKIYILYPTEKWKIRIDQHTRNSKTMKKNDGQKSEQVSRFRFKFYHQCFYIFCAYDARVSESTDFHF